MHTVDLFNMNLQRLLESNTFLHYRGVTTPESFRNVAHFAVGFQTVGLRSQFFFYMFITNKCFLVLCSRRRMRTVTTAMSVLFVCQTSETPSSCPADTCVSATPVLTPCVTRPTTVLSADCVRSDASFFPIGFQLGFHALANRK